MQVSGMKVYRPGMFVSIVLDWLIYGNQAWGYFLSNLLYLSGAAVTMYFFCRALSKRWLQTNSVLFALSSASLFAANPLHCQTISWMVGRGDPLSALFYLLALLFFVYFLEKPRRLMMALSLSMFVVALSVKELPVGAAPVTSVLAFFWMEESASFRSRLLNAIRFSSPFWIALVLYFIIRYLCIGTLGGGYVDGVGAGQLAAMLKHWLDRDTIERIFLPVSSEVARQSLYALPVLRVLDTFIFTIACIRLLSGCWSWRWVFLMAALMLTAAAPIFQLWGLGPNLEGSRFYFFLSISLSMLAPLFLFHPPREALAKGSSEAQINPGRYGFALTLLSIATQLALVFMLARITFKTNGLWVHAGKEDLHLSEECQQLAEKTDKQRHIVLFGIPDDYHGANLILNRTMFQLMLSPPIAKEDYGSRFLTTIPIMYGPEQYVNGSRLREIFKSPDVIGPYLWLRNKQRLKLIDLPTISDRDLKPLTQLTPLSTYPGGFRRGGHRLNGDYLVTLENLDLNPLVVDCIEFDLTATGSSEEPLKVFWTGSSSPPPPEPEEEAPAEFVAAVKLRHVDGTQTVRIRLGHYWRWYACGRIISLEIVPPPSTTCRIQNIRLVPYSAIAPTLKLSTKAQDHYLSTLPQGKVDLSVDKGTLAGASSMQLEVGKSNFFFDNFADRSDVDPVAFKISVPSGAKTLSLENSGKYFPGPGYYQLRLRCLDQQGSAVGECSDPVTLLK